MSGNFDVAELLIGDCQKLEELPKLSEVERIKMEQCQKMQFIAGIEELQRLETRHLSQVGSNFIQGLQSIAKLPSEYMTVIGRAADGWESSLSVDIFGNHAVCELHTVDGSYEQCVEVSVDDVTEESDCVSAIIVCAVVVARRSPAYITAYGFNGRFMCSEVGEGEWIVTIVITDQTSIQTSILLKIWRGPPNIMFNS